MSQRFTDALLGFFVVVVAKVAVTRPFARGSAPGVIPLARLALAATLFEQANIIQSPSAICWELFC